MTKLDALRVTDSPFKRRYGNFIGGQWVEPASGQTFAIAGLYEQYSAQSGAGVPGISQVLGRNQRTRRERELMIFITPYLAEATDAVAQRPRRAAPQSSVGFITR